MTDQPIWKLIANLGDINPIEYGGYFIYQDNTGVYTEEAELLISPDSDNNTWAIYRFSLDRCTFRRNTATLSDNKYHPEICAWFAKRESERARRPQDSTYLSNVAEFTGLTTKELRTMFCNENPIDRAHAYRAVGEYHGFENLDSCPLVIPNRAEVEKRYSAEVTP